jgi:putative ABC transport system permease protein
VSALHRKLLRDMSSLKGQSAAIAVVIGCGVMVLILFATSLEAVRMSRDGFYRSHNFAHLFSEMTRAPEAVGQRLGMIPGVNVVETRVRAPVRLAVAGFDDPVRGIIISIPDGRQPGLNRLYLREGAWPEPGRGYQVLVAEPFAEAHGLRAGDRLEAIIKGRKETLTIAGIALSPEFIYQVGPADIMPDYERFTILWMNRDLLSGAFGMEGAFNSVAVSLQAGANARMVIDEMNRILAPYGSIGAHGREDQVSHRFLEEEIAQLRVMTVVLPAIFLGVSAFLLSVLMSRIVRTQRQQIAVLKAFGYRNGEIGWHYLLLTGLIVSLGSLLGVALGALAARGMAVLYAEYFRFPQMHFGLQPRIILLAVAVAFAAGMAGAGRAVGAAVRLAPAQAMRPPAPKRFRKGWLEQSFAGRLLDQTSRIIVRHIARHRLKTAMSVLGIGMSGALLLLGSYQFGSVTYMLDVQYRLVQKMDLHLSFNEQTPKRAVAELRALPGVEYVEPYRTVPVRLRHGGREYRTAILGLNEQPQLRAVLDADYRPVRLPPEGLLMTRYLADYLRLRPGDRVGVEIMEGHRRVLELPLAGTVQEPIGISAYMEIGALNRHLREGPAISGAWVLWDPDRQRALFDRLWDIPAVAGIGIVSGADAAIRDYIEDTVLVFMMILLIMAGSITFAVAYNNVRIAFAERLRELATLRVMGFYRTEVAWILIGEIAAVTLMSIPLGWALGAGFALLLNQAISTDLFRLPFVLSPRVFAFSAGGVLAAAALSVLFIVRRLNRLDMAAALKTE